METNIQIFKNPQFGEIRTAGTSEQPLFCLADLCRALNLSNPTAVAAKLDAEDKPKLNLGLPGQSPTFVTESGMYTVILRSDSPLAKPMQKWVTSEILPAIRKSGGYMAAKVDETPEEIMARALVVAQDTINRQKQRVQMLEGEREHLSAEVKQLAPKAEYTDEVLQSTSTYTFTQMSKELNLRSVYVLEDRLKQAGVIFKQSGQWMLTCKYAGKGYTATRTARYFHDDGTPGTSTSTVWTERGRAFLHQLGKGGAL